MCFGDLDAIAGKALLDEVNKTSSGSPVACFKVTDVTQYQSMLELFDLCFQTYRRVDSAVSCAGIIEIGNWFDPNLDLETIRQVSRRHLAPDETKH